MNSWVYSRKRRCVAQLLKQKLAITILTVMFAFRSRSAAQLYTHYLKLLKPTLIWKVGDWDPRCEHSRVSNMANYRHLQDDGRRENYCCVLSDVGGLYYLLDILRTCWRGHGRVLTKDGVGRIVSTLQEVKDEMLYCSIRNRWWKEETAGNQKSAWTSLLQRKRYSPKWDSEAGSLASRGILNCSLG